MMTLVELKALLETFGIEREDDEHELFRVINRYMEASSRERQVELGRVILSPDERWNQLLELQSLEDRLSELLMRWNASHPDEACILPGEEV